MPAREATRSHRLPMARSRPLRTHPLLQRAAMTCARLLHHAAPTTSARLLLHAVQRISAPPPSPRSPTVKSRLLRTQRLLHSAVIATVRLLHHVVPITSARLLRTYHLLHSVVLGTAWLLHHVVSTTSVRLLRKRPLLHSAVRIASARLTSLKLVTARSRLQLTRQRQLRPVVPTTSARVPLSPKDPTTGRLLFPKSATVKSKHQPQRDHVGQRQPVVQVASVRLPASQHLTSLGPCRKSRTAKSRHQKQPCGPGPP
jgi:hypothetical protein